MSALGGPDDWDGLIVLVAGSPYRTTYGLQYASQHVARELTKYAPVLYVDPVGTPNAIVRRYGKQAMLQPRVRIVAPRLAVLSGIGLPSALRRGTGGLTRWLAAQSLRRALHRLGGPVHATVLFSTAHHLFDVGSPGVRVYYAKDDFSAAAELLGGSAAGAKQAEEACAARADVVVAHSPALLERWKAYDPVFIPNGVDASLFAGASGSGGALPVPDDVELPRPIVAFAGNLAKRVDWSLLEAVAERGRSVLLIGPPQPSFDVTTIDAFLARPNVHWLRGRPYEQLPAYFGGVDVGVVPYTDTPFNRASFPLKALEYLAAGLPVVSTDLPAMRWLGTDLVTITAPDPVAFADAVDAAIATRPDTALIEQRRAFAAEHDWSARVATLASVLGLPALADR